MSNDLVVSDDELMSVLRSSVYPGAKDESIRLVVNYCKAKKLDPIQKPLHIVPMWDSKLEKMRDTILPGIGLYRTQASRSGVLAGISEPEFGPEVTEFLSGQNVTYPLWCKVTVKKYDSSGHTRVAEFTAIERWKENYAIKGGKEKSIAPNSMWAKRSYGQLAKCTEAQALRKAFPEFGSQPTAEEMEGKQYEGDTYEAQPEVDITPKPKKPATSAKPKLESAPPSALEVKIADLVKAFAQINIGENELIEMLGAPLNNLSDDMIKVARDLYKQYLSEHKARQAGQAVHDPIMPDNNAEEIV